jgi:hypothetical protein
MVTAYVKAAERAYPLRLERARFWADRLGMERGAIEKLIDSAPAFKDIVRAKLMKRGGAGYVQPGPEAFPTVEEFHELIVACGALPCFAWLDGTSEGEQAIEELLGLMLSKGVVTMNIVPDRNWNIADSEVRRIKVRNLHEVVEIAEALALPLNVGTEMNSHGKKLVDDFDAPELAPVREAFLSGAYFVYGHTVAQRSLGIGYQSEWAQSSLPMRTARNDFYVELGRRVPPGVKGLRRLSEQSVAMSPADILASL